MMIRAEFDSVADFIRDTSLKLRICRLEEIEEPFYESILYEDMEEIWNVCVNSLPEQYADIGCRYPDNTWSKMCIPVVAYVERENGYVSEFGLYSHSEVSHMCDSPVTFLTFKLPDFEMSMEYVSVSMNPRNERGLYESEGYEIVEHKLSERDVSEIYSALGMSKESLKVEVLQYMRQFYEDISYDTLYSEHVMTKDIIDRMCLLGYVDRVLSSYGYFPIRNDYHSFVRVIEVRDDGKIVIKENAYKDEHGNILSRCIIDPSKDRLMRCLCILRSYNNPNLGYKRWKNVTESEAEAARVSVSCLYNLPISCIEIEEDGLAGRMVFKCPVKDLSKYSSNLYVAGDGYKSNYIDALTAVALGTIPGHVDGGVLHLMLDYTFTKTVAEDINRLRGLDVREIS